jgi:hypothetical protein
MFSWFRKEKQVENPECAQEQTQPSGNKNISEKSSILGLRNKLQGKKALAICTGPSLGYSGVISKLSKKISTFGVNDLSQYYDPNYLIAFDSLEPSKKIYKHWVQSKAVKVLADSRESYGLETYSVKVNKRTKFPKDWWESEESTWFLASGTSCLLPIQLAAYAGCKEIVLVGADFGSFDGYQYAWDVPPEAEMQGRYEISYKYATKRDQQIINNLAEALDLKFKEIGIKVYDASFGTFLPFEKMCFKDFDKWLR